MRGQVIQSRQTTSDCVRRPSMGNNGIHIPINNNNNREKAKRRINIQKKFSPFRGATKEIESVTFVFSEWKTMKWADSMEKFLEYVSQFCVETDRRVSSVKYTHMADDRTVPPVTATYPNSQKLEEREDDFVEEESCSTYRRCLKAKSALESNFVAFYSILWEQCDVEMKGRIQCHKNYKLAKSERDVFALMVIIEDICAFGDTCQYPPLRYVMIKKRLLNLHEHPNTNLATYRHNIETLARIEDTARNAVIEYAHSVTLTSSARGKAWEDLSKDDKDIVTREAQDMIQAALFIENSSYAQFSELKRDLHNRYILGTNIYPKNVDRAYKMMTSYSEVTR